MTSPNPSVPRVVSFGCRLNALDGDALADWGAAQGFSGTLINACAVTGEALRQARQAARRAKRAAPASPVWVTGCGAAIAPAAFAMPEVARVVARPALAPPAAQPRARALVQVQTGCEHDCTFCVIPQGRGRRVRSTPAAEVVAEVRRLVRRGHKEVVLTGVDITSWGTERGAARLGALVRAVLDGVPDLARLRLSSLDAVELDAGFLDIALHEERLMPHLHLSLQAGDDLVLKRMKRRHARDDAVRFCEHVRARRPDITFGADLIAGFPTESEAAHARSLALIKDCQLVWCHIFPFSPHASTPAARMPQVPREVVRARAQALREEARRVQDDFLQAQIGRHKNVLVERGGEHPLARAEDFCQVRIEAPAEAGELLRVRITGREGSVLLA